MKNIAECFQYLSIMLVRIGITILLLMYSLLSYTQDGFILTHSKNQVSLPFKLINNLIFIPVEVNGYSMTFLLDSGVEETVLFSLEEQEEVKFYNIETIKLRGLGNQEPFEALKSSQNTLTISKYFEDKNHTILIILDQNINFSSTVGIPVNGIIGYHFFRNHLVFIDYASKKIHIKSHEHRKFNRQLKKYDLLPITVEGNKPYIEGEFSTTDLTTSSKLLIDTGNSYPVWLFDHLIEGLIIPEPNFEDYLGKGFSGDIFGKQARIQGLKLGNFEFIRPITAFPDSISLMNVKMVENRAGSVGGSILKRMNVVFDYKNERLYAKKNSNFYQEYLYNASGLEVYQIGMQWIQEKISLNTGPVKVSNESHYTGNKSDFMYKFNLKPVYSIGVVRNNSPAQKAGLKVDDLLLEINKRKVTDMSLEDINQILRSEAGKKISLKVERNQVVHTFSFMIEKML